MSDPGSQSVSSKLTVDWGLYLASKRDFIYARIDVRGSRNSGDRNLYEPWHRLGTVEVEDYLHVIDVLKADLHYVDPKRTAVWGWSYGAFVAASLISHERSTFNCAIAVAPVTNWLFAGLSSLLFLPVVSFIISFSRFFHHFFLPVSSISFFHICNLHLLLFLLLTEIGRGREYLDVFVCHLSWDRRSWQNNIAFIHSFSLSRVTLSELLFFLWVSESRICHEKISSWEWKSQSNTVILLASSFHLLCLFSYFISLLSLLSLFFLSFEVLLHPDWYVCACYSVSLTHLFPLLFSFHLLLLFLSFLHSFLLSFFHLCRSYSHFLSFPETRSDRLPSQWEVLILVSISLSTSNKWEIESQCWREREDELFRGESSTRENG